MSLTSENRRRRAQALEVVVRRLQSESAVSWETIADALGISRTALMKALERGLLRASDLVILDALLPGVLAELARGRGQRLLPDVTSRATQEDVLQAATATLGQAADVVRETTKALAGGISDGEARLIGREICEAREAMNELEARVEAAVVTPLRRHA